MHLDYLHTLPNEKKPWNKINYWYINVWFKTDLPVGLRARNSLVCSMFGVCENSEAKELYSFPMIVGIYLESLVKYYHIWK